MTIATPDDVLQGLREHFDETDDRDLWTEVLRRVVVAEHSEIVTSYTGKDRLVLEIGRCSHWLRPHQTRWSAAGGFAWPAGYGDGNPDRSFSPLRTGRTGLPEFDWSMRWIWATATEFCPIDGWVSRRPLTLRIAVPARTTRHRQAVVHTVWTPGSPWKAGDKTARFFGFRKTDNGWNQVARSGAMGWLTA